MLASLPSLSEAVAAADAHDAAPRARPALYYVTGAAGDGKSFAVSHQVDRMRAELAGAGKTLEVVTVAVNEAAGAATDAGDIDLTTLLANLRRPLHAIAVRHDVVAELHDVSQHSLLFG